MFSPSRVCKNPVCPPVGSVAYRWSSVRSMDVSDWDPRWPVRSADLLPQQRWHSRHVAVRSGGSCSSGIWPALLKHTGGQQTAQAWGESSPPAGRRLAEACSAGTCWFWVDPNDQNRSWRSSDRKFWPKSIFLWVFLPPSVRNYPHSRAPSAGITAGSVP